MTHVEHRFRDRAVCMRTRRSTTDIATCHGKYVIKAASTTQTVIALSSGGSYCVYAMVRGRSVGHEGHGQRLYGCIGDRFGAGKERHVDTQWLRVHKVFHRRRATILKIPGASNQSDLKSNLSDGQKIQYIVQDIGYHYTMGGAQ